MVYLYNSVRYSYSRIPNVLNCFLARNRYSTKIDFRQHIFCSVFAIFFILNTKTNTQIIPFYFFLLNI